MGLLSSLWEDWKARCRGEHRVAPRGVRGRVYARSGEPGGIMAAFSAPQAWIQMRVYRAAEDQWYHRALDGYVVVHGEVIWVEYDPPVLQRE